MDSHWLENAKFYIFNSTQKVYFFLILKDQKHVNVFEEHISQAFIIRLKPVCI